VEYDPAAVGSNSGTLTLTTNGGSSPAIPLTGAATTDVSISPTSLAFGTISYGTTKVVNLVVSNVGKIASLTVTSAISGTGAADFSVLTTGNTCTSGVAPGKTCTLPVQFKPAAVAAYTATLTLTTNGGSNPAIALTGTGATDVSVSPTSLAFGTITHATTKVLNVVVSNVGTITSLTVTSAISGTGAADFSVLTTGNTCTSGVAPGKTCTLPVQFKPAAVASYTATLTLTTNGGSNPAISLTGTGD
jgi:hypothetical protein